MQEPIQQCLRVLIAERHRTIAESLSRVVSALGNAEVTGTAESSTKAIELSQKVLPDVAIVDLDLSPNCSLVSGLQALSPETRVIVMADRDTPADSLVKALASGAVGAIYKETSFEDLSRAIHSSSRSKPVVAEEAAGLLLSLYVDALTDKRARDLATIEALAAAVEVRDAVTGEHLDRVTSLALECLQEIDVDLARNEEVSYGFTLHDVGKIGVPDAVLNKPGPLDPHEWEVMKLHPSTGVRIVEPLGFSEAATEIILCHHERWDGTGYPNRLVGEEIPLTARVFSVADAYDAMTSDRPYRPAMSHGAAVASIKEKAGEMHDPEVVDLFLQLKD